MTDKFKTKMENSSNHIQLNTKCIYQESIKINYKVCYFMISNENFNISIQYKERVYYQWCFQNVKIQLTYERREVILQH